MPETRPHALYRIEPVILLAFANDRYEPDQGYLRNLVVERRAIEEVLGADGAARRYRVVIEQNLTHARLEALVAQHRDAIVGFHYGGHADSVGLQLEDELGRPDRVDAAAIAETLASLPRLRWICLNGCSTRPHLDALHGRMTVPVVATKRTIPDETARRFAARLYTALVGGSSLADAFAAAEDEDWGDPAALVDPQATRLLGPADDEIETEWPWALFAHPKRPRATDWTLAGELAMYGVAGRLALPRTVRLPRNAVAQLLVARHGVVPFAGREAELATLDDWADDPEPTRVRLIHGPGGAGKTRLLVEWIRRRAERELAGFLHGALDADTAATIAEARAATIVIDSAETRPGLFEVLARLARRWSEGQPGRIRVVLLARNADEWWSSLKARSEDVDGLLQDSQAPLRLPALVDEAHRPAEFARAARAFAAQRKTDPPAEAPDLSHPRFGRALYLHMAALAAVDGLTLNADGLLDGLLTHEKRMWCARADIDPGDTDRSDVFTREAEAFMGAVTLRGGVSDRRGAEDVAARFTADGPALVRTLRTIHGDDAAWVSPIEPDLLGEALVGGLLESRYWPDWLKTAAEGAGFAELEHGFVMLGRIEASSAEAPRRAAAVDGFATLLGADFDLRARAAFDAVLALGAQTAHSRLGARLAEALNERGTRALAEHFDERVPGTTTMLREVGLWTAQTLLNPAGDAGDEALVAKARRLNESGARLSGLGRRDEALAATAQAADIIRELAARRPGEFLSDLAACLNNLSSDHLTAGQLVEARSTAEEAVQVGRTLAASGDDEHLDALATTLYTLGLVGRATGQLETARAAVEESVDLYRGLEARHPSSFVDDFASGLNLLGALRAASGQRAEALAAMAEAVDLWRGLAAANPDGYLSSLAMSLDNLGHMQAAVGRLSDALSSTAEALQIRRRLADDRRDAFLPELALSLTNSGKVLADAGRWAEALPLTDEALAIYRGLAADEPAAFMPQLAQLLDNRGSMSMMLGRPDEAVSASREAVDILRSLADGQPAAFAPNLATALSTLGATLTATGQAEAASAASEEAIGVIEGLTVSQAIAFMPLLAQTRANLGASRRLEGKPTAALAAFEASVDLYGALAQADPETFGGPLANSLTAWSGLLAEVGRTPEAVRAAERALTAIWDLFERAPTALGDMTRFLLMQQLQLMGGAPDETLLERLGRFDVLVPPAHGPEAAESQGTGAPSVVGAAAKATAGDTAGAIVELEACLETLTAEGRLPEAVTARAMLGAFYAAAGRFDDGRAQFESALEMATKFGMIDMIQHVRGLLSQLE